MYQLIWIKKSILLGFLSLLLVSGKAQQAPYNGTNSKIPGKIEIEHFDVGGEGVAYHDVDPENNGVSGGSTYRVDEGVDINADGVLGWFKDGEWLEYTVDVEAGMYNVTVQVGTPQNGKHLEIYLDEELLTRYEIPNTGSYEVTSRVIKNVRIAESGENRILKLKNVNNDFDFDWIAFEKAEDPVVSFNFKHHSIGSKLPVGIFIGMQTLADYTNDGLMDMTIGSKYDGLFLLKNEGDSWSSQRLADIPFQSLGAVSMDVNHDGWIDIVGAGVWYQNNQGTSATVHVYDPVFVEGNEFHDLVAADLDGDGKKDIAGMGDQTGFYWYKIPEDPTDSWTRVTVEEAYPNPQDRVHGGFSPNGIGDLDGDGDADIFRTNAWFENRSNGQEWIKHSLHFDELFQGSLPYGKSMRSVVIDIDNDGDNDVVFSECDKIYAKIGILKNIRGDGSEWQLELLPQNAPGGRSSLHSLQVVDFNQDGLVDILTVDQEDMLTEDLHDPRWYMYYQTFSGWEEEVLFDIKLGGHDILMGDVDQDGDLDFVSKVWTGWDGNAADGRTHTDYFENLQIQRSSAGERLSSDIDQWTSTGARWEQNGDWIIGGKLPEDRNQGGILLTKKKYGDFEVVLDVWPDYNFDSGIFLRTTGDGAKAYQVTVDYHDDYSVGGVYLQGLGGGSFWDFTTKDRYHIQGNPAWIDLNAWSYIWNPYDWNQFRIRIEGNPPTIYVWLNGWKVNEYTDNQLRLENDGYFGLQVHSGVSWGPENEIRFKNIKIYSLNSTSVAQDFQHEPLKVYPNPVREQLTLLGVESDSQIAVYTVTGVCIYQGTSSRDFMTILDTAEWPSGLYLLNVRSPIDAVVRSIKVVKN